MKSSLTAVIRLAAAAACAALLASVCAAAAPANSPAAQDKGKDKAKEQGVKLSGDEKKALKKVTDAKDAQAKLTAAGEFVQKFPQSAARVQIADELARAISQATDPAQRVSLAEGFINTFTNADETYYIYPVLIDAYLNSGKVEQAFEAASTWLESNPNEPYVMYRLALVGTNEAQNGNNKYAQQSAQYGAKAIQLMEADQRPKSLTEEDWTKSKSTWLTQLYQATGMLAMMSRKGDEAQARLQKAIALSPNDPMSYALLASAKNDEYQQLVTQYKITPAGPAAEAARQKAEAKLDEVIDLYAHAIALSEGKPQYEPMRNQTMVDLTVYYKARHNNSTEGMQKLIDKYKTPSAP